LQGEWNFYASLMFMLLFSTFARWRSHSFLCCKDSKWSVNSHWLLFGMLGITLLHKIILHKIDNTLFTTAVVNLICIRCLLYDMYVDIIRINSTRIWLIHLTSDYLWCHSDCLNYVFIAQKILCFYTTWFPTLYVMYYCTYF
jgi:hypothetical protein